jgi:hypothetical protein
LNFISTFVLIKSLTNGTSNISHNNRRARKLIVIAASSKHSGDCKTFCKLASLAGNSFDLITAVRCVPLASTSSVSGSIV